jgi:sigma-B regulation protein RsbU (phosphoserine phosphatase)
LLWSISGIGIGTLITLVFLFLPPSLLFTSAAEIVVIHVAFTTSLIAGTMVYAIARYSLAPSIEELRRREEQLRREKAEAQAREAELQRQVLDAQIREERRRQEELERELRTAHDLQMKLMPKESPRIAGLEMAGCCLPATHVGGDYFQYFHRDGRLSFCLADVTGHAMQAAIPVVMFSGILESQMELAAPVEELFGRLNRSLCRVLDRRTFVCFAMGELDLSTRLLRLSNGGCPYPYLFRAGTGQVCEVQLDAYPLGIRSDTSYRVEEIPLEEGDVVVLCSDGIIEAENNLGELFGFERTLGLIAGAPARSAESLLAHIVGAVRAFTGNAPLTDDMTCIVLRLVEKS